MSRWSRDSATSQAKPQAGLHVMLLTVHMAHGDMGEELRRVRSLGLRRPMNHLTRTALHAISIFWALSVVESIWQSAILIFLGVGREGSGAYEADARVRIIVFRTRAALTASITEAIPAAAVPRAKPKADRYISGFSGSDITPWCTVYCTIQLTFS